MPTFISHTTIRISKHKLKLDAVSMELSCHS